MVIIMRSHQQSSTTAEVGDLRVQFEQALHGAMAAAWEQS